MDYFEFLASTTNPQPPSVSSLHLQALWYDKKNNWDKAHTIAQDIHDEFGSRIHAYLHRREDDNSNARYWYNKAGQPFPKDSLEMEWENMVKELLA